MQVVGAALERESAWGRTRRSWIRDLAGVAGAVAGATTLAMVSLIGVQLTGDGSAGAVTAPTPVCTASTCTVTYGPGVGQAFTVPTGVSSLSLTVWGAAGGSADHTAVTTSGAPTPGGKGADVTATLAVAEGAPSRSTSAAWEGTATSAAAARAASTVVERAPLLGLLPPAVGAAGRATSSPAAPGSS